MKLATTIAAVLMIALTLNTVPVKATETYTAFTDANKLNVACIQADNVATASIVGMWDGFAFTGAAKRWNICLPDGATATQLRLVVCKHLNDNPKDLHKGAVENAVTAFAQAFPCDD